MTLLWFCRAVAVAEAPHQGQEKVQNFCEEIVPQLSDRRFREQFRLSRAAAADVRNNLEAERGDEEGNRQPRIAMGKKLLLFLWYLGSIVSFRKTAILFGLLWALRGSALTRWRRCSWLCESESSDSHLEHS